MSVFPGLRRALLVGSALVPTACGHPVDGTSPGRNAAEAPRHERRDAPPAGVVRPPAGIDPGIQAPAPVPNPGTTPVIPPPGTPGGDPRVQPR